MQWCKGKTIFHWHTGLKCSVLCDVSLSRMMLLLPTWSVSAWPSLIDYTARFLHPPAFIHLLIFPLTEGWPHSSHAYIQFPSNQEEMLFRGGTL